MICGNNNETVVPVLSWSEVLHWKAKCYHQGANSTLEDFQRTLVLRDMESHSVVQ